MNFIKVDNISSQMKFVKGTMLMSLSMSECLLPQLESFKSLRKGKRSKDFLTY